MSHKVQTPAGVRKPATPARPDPHRKRDVDTLRQQITDLIGQKPDQAAIILTEWLRQADQKLEKSTKKPTKKVS